MHRLVRTLIIEDDPALALDLEQILKEYGAETVMLASSNQAAHTALRDQRITFATLDVSLSDGEALEVADDLDARGVPFLIITGRTDRELPPRLQLRPLVRKPISAQGVHGALRAILR